MSRKREAIQLAIAEIGHLDIDHAGRQKALSNAQGAGVTVTDFLWAHATLTATRGELITEELLTAEEFN